MNLMCSKKDSISISINLKFYFTIQNILIMWCLYNATIFFLQTKTKIFDKNKRENSAFGTSFQKEEN